MLKAEQATLLKEMVSEGKNAVIRLPMGLLKPADPLKILKTDVKITQAAKFFSYLLPLIVNRTVFRRRGFVIRILTTIIAGKVGKRTGPGILKWLLDRANSYLDKNQSPEKTRASVKIKTKHSILP